MKYICDVHDEIQDLSEEIVNMIEHNEIDLYKFKHNSVMIFNLTEKAKRSGIKMEKRLKEYKHGIEKMGFKRIKNV